MRLIKFFCGVILTSLLLNCGGGNDKKDIVTPPNPPVVSKYGIFRNLKAANTVAPLVEQASVNQSLTMSFPREGHKAIMLNDGRVMLIGGEIIRQGEYPTVSIADFFDPVSERFSPSTTNALMLHKYDSVDRFSIVKITDGLYAGKVLLIGGVIANNNGVIEIYDPTTDSYEMPNDSKTILNSGLGFSVDQAFWLGDNKVLLCGNHYYGESVNTPFMILNLATWTVSNVPNSPSNIWGEYIKAPDGNIIAISGVDQVSYTEVTDNGVYRFNVTDFSVTKIGTINKARGAFGLALFGNKLGIYGGVTGRSVNGNAVATNSVEVYDLTTNLSTNSTSLIAARFFQSSIMLQNGFVLNAGGCNFDGQTVSSEFVHNPISGESGSTGTLNTPRRFYSAVTLNNGMILISGGETGNQIDGANDKLNTAEIYDPQSKLIISFTTDHVSVRGTLQFTSNYANGVDWSCDAGAIDASGLFKPKITGLARIKATAKDNPNLSAEVEIVVE